MSLESTEGDRTVHTIAINLTPAKAGDIDRTLNVDTSLTGEKPVKIRIVAKVK